MTSLHLRDIPASAVREHRETFTEQQVAAAVASATGTAASGLTATVEASAGWWERAFSAGHSDVLEPWKLGRIGRGIGHVRRIGMVAQPAWPCRGLAI